jgi:hypothetical protein
MDERPGFWKTTTGLLTAIGGLVGALAAVVTALAATGALSGSGTARADPVTPPPVPTTTTTTTFTPPSTTAEIGTEPTIEPSGGGAAQRYPADVEANFTSSCLANGGTDEGCRCALETFESELSLAEFIAVEAQLNSTGTITDPTISALFEAVQIRCQ